MPGVQQPLSLVRVRSGLVWVFVNKWALSKYELLRTKVDFNVGTNAALQNQGHGHVRTPTELLTFMLLLQNHDWWLQASQVLVVVFATKLYDVGCDTRILPFDWLSATQLPFAEYFKQACRINGHDPIPRKVTFIETALHIHPKVTGAVAIGR